MKLTIIPSDNAVYKNDYFCGGLDLSFVPSNVHALQWKNTTGWVEFVDDDNGTKPQNEPITSLPDWANTCLTKWDEAKATKEAAILAAQQSAQNQPATQGTQTL